MDFYFLWRWGIEKETLFMVISMSIPNKEYGEPWHENPRWNLKWSANYRDPHTLNPNIQ
jgi:hypothetical protein